MEENIDSISGCYPVDGRSKCPAENVGSHIPSYLTGDCHLFG
jgi:hypothetical protein